MVALAPRTSPGSAILTISVFPSVDEVVSFARPLQRMNTPRGSSPSTNRRDPFGYNPVNFTVSSAWTAGALMLQKIRSARTRHSAQLYSTSRLYGDGIRPPFQSDAPTDAPIPCHITEFRGSPRKTTWMQVTCRSDCYHTM